MTSEQQRVDSETGFGGRLAEVQKARKRLTADSYTLHVAGAMPCE